MTAIAQLILFGAPVIVYFLVNKSVDAKLGHRATDIGYYALGVVLMSVTGFYAGALFCFALTLEAYRFRRLAFTSDALRKQLRQNTEGEA